MKTDYLFLCIVFFLLYSCKTPAYLPKQYKIGEVEHFDFEEFEKNKSERFPDEYFFKKKDTIKVIKAIKGNYILETFTIYPKNYKLIKRYYPNGIIKERGKEYYYRSNGFKIGIWEYFDDAGNLVKTEDMDKRYKVSYKKALRKVFWRYGFLKKNLKIEMSSGDWILTNIKGCQRGKSASVNRETGEVKRVKIKVIHMNYTGKDIEDYMEESRRKNFESKPDSTTVNRK